VIRARLTVPILVSLAAVIAAALAGSASAVAIGCGSVLTTNTTLTADLRACPGDGLVVAADGITINLAGHTITGTGQGVGIRILNSGDVVRDGSVEGFFTGIQSNDFPRSAGTSVLRVKVSRNAGSGVAFYGFGETLARSVVTSNGFDGVLLAGSDGTTVTDNKVFRNAVNGIDGRPHADGAAYTNNEVTENGNDGIATSDSTARAITGNTTSRNGGDGIDIRDIPGFAQFYLVAANLADDNGGHGITACILNFDSGNLCEGGFVDGGGNAAKHNATEPQCVNIVCAYNRGHARVTSVAPGEHAN
jgi:parallel beta-helix repeat protein